MSAGQPYPLGAVWDGKGVNFALFSEHATRVELCLFDSPGATRESARLDLPEQTDQVWHGHVPGLAPGQLYGYRVHGTFAPEHGDRFNPAKVLFDPYGKAVGRPITWAEENFGYPPDHPDRDRVRDERDNAASAALAAVIDPAFEWGDDRRPHTPWHETVIYELHVRGFTKRHPDVPEALRGTYGGVVADAALGHLESLGVTAVELMPVHHFTTTRHLVERGLDQYWGYDTLAYLAPTPRYATTSSGLDAVREFKTMVKGLHAAGIEVILDVVYNHTAEGNHLGPTLSWRGIDNGAYYRLDDRDRSRYLDFTGCGNTLNMTHPRVLQLIMDSLRYWVLEMHVDGFRFDLASALARELYEVDKLGAFFDIIHQDPVISQVKLIAEPWDLGHGGYQVGNFPVLWTEWNGRYRDAVRRFWRGDAAATSEMATRLAGSADLYEHSGRRPHASINFVTAHDGFSLQDLVSYEHKHNEANGEDNRDGEDHNLSANHGGIEGPTDDPPIVSLRERQKRNFLATLLMSQGVPMLRAGDELSHTQGGNNNAYCQDNEISWLDWDLDERRSAFLAFARAMLRLRREHHALKRRRFLHGHRIRGRDIKDIAWFAPSGLEMAEQEWHAAASCFGVQLVPEPDGDGEPHADATLLILFNAGPTPVTFALPAHTPGESWALLLDTRDAMPATMPTVAGASLTLDARSVVVLRAEPVPARTGAPAAARRGEGAAQAASTEGDAARPGAVAPNPEVRT